MNILDIIEKGNNELHPKALLVVYDDYIEIAKFYNKTIGAFSPLTKETLQGLVKASLDNNETYIINGHVPKNVEYVSFGIGNTIIVFKEPKLSERSIYITSGKMKINTPNLLMIVNNNSFYVYCYANSKLKDSTRIYKAPFSNSLHDNDVCFGNIKVPKHDDINQIITAYQTVYWNSTFEMTKSEAKEKMKNSFTKQNYICTYKELIDELS